MLGFGFRFYYTHPGIVMRDSISTIEGANAAESISQSTKESQKLAQTTKQIDPVAGWAQRSNSDILSALRLENGERFFHFVRSTSFVDFLVANPEDAFASIKARLLSPLPKFPEEDAHFGWEIQQELTFRLGLIKSLSGIPPENPTLRDLAGDLYKKIIVSPIPNFMEQRAALQALQVLGVSLDSEERQKILASVDRRVIASLHLSDDELLERVLP
jgi:hypothetical protein